MCSDVPDAGEEEEHGHVPDVHADDEADPGHNPAVRVLRVDPHEESNLRQVDLDGVVE